MKVIFINLQLFIFSTYTIFAMQLIPERILENSLKEHLIQQAHIPRYFLHDEKELSDSQNPKKKHNISALAFSPDGKRLISAHNKAIQVWALSDLHKLEFNSNLLFYECNGLTQPQLAKITAIASYNDNQTIFCGSRAGSIFIQKLNERGYVSFKTPCTIKSIVFSIPHPQNVIALASSYGNLHSVEFNINTKQKISQKIKNILTEDPHLKNLTMIQNTMALSPQGRFFTICSNEIINLFALRKDTFFSKTPEVNSFHEAISILGFSQDEDIFAFGTQKKDIFLYYGSQSQYLLTTHSDITAIAFSHDNNFIAVGLHDGTIILLRSIKSLSLDDLSLINKLYLSPNLSRNQLQESEQTIYDQIPPKALPKWLQ